MYYQQSLFEHCTENEKPFHKKIEKSGFKYEAIDIGDITFKTGQDESIHRWYRLTPSYSPELVRFFIREFEINREDYVLDPFSGRGTTSIECQKYGIRNLGIEINPLLQQVGNKSLIWDHNNFQLFEEYIAEISNLIDKYTDKNIEEVITEFDTRLPIIYNLFRWWKEDVLKDLIICREVMLNFRYLAIKDYIWLAINKACLDCANIHRNHPTITFDDNHKRQINVFSEVNSNIKVILYDLKSLSAKQLSFSERGSIILGNSTVNLIKQVKYPVGFVITSPPYPNRYSYVHQTRPQLHFMEILDNVSQATEIDLQAVGGTWGRATSILQNELINIPEDIRPFLCFYNELKDENILMCNYASKYFINMWKHIKNLREVSKKGFKGAYIVGNSRLSGVEIFTESILSKIFSHEGFEVEKIILLRKRGGKKHLYETAICIKS